MNYLHYLAKFVSGTLVVLLLTFIINLIFDPLWYMGGNKVDDYNYAFDERTSKLNLVENSDFNCLILGSSRVTFIRPSEIKSATCFNSAFSRAVVEEFLPYINRLKFSGMNKLDYLIIGVDGFNFFGESKFKNIPRTAVAESPPIIFESYLSFDTLVFSYRLFTEDANLPRFYDKNFEVDVHKSIPTFDPKHQLAGAIEGGYYPSKLSEYMEVVEVAEAQAVIFYVPPLSAWHIQDLDKKGELENYIKAIYEFVNQGFTIIDYSIISPVTKNKNNTYDGHHYLPHINSLITSNLHQIMKGQRPELADFGVVVNNYSFTSFVALYKGRLAQFKQENIH
ncbi:hypothetical protein DXX93_00630 [Thalassotalea euphylliae]|uniref:Uncharacterized protein n=1 Tax=Thalassotalea euphylliae TaxID=1655234 RepID=A0A3E0TL12_9GAMM|nr:hypothetical protein [Thalassotalea euphylliae]REL25206.1 hypothetical protein DXX93_00630 [Thalassotalea euphylliae]